MERRDLIRITLSGAVAGPQLLAQHAHTPGAEKSAIEGYSPKVFTAGQKALVDHLTDVIIPADERSPGAREAKVSLYIDMTLSYSPESQRESWRRGLEAVDAESSRLFGKRFVEISRSRQEQIVAGMAKNESAPKTVLERFFEIVKRSTVNAYISSEVGVHQYLRYKGNTVLTEFAGCEHPKHS